MFRILRSECKSFKELFSVARTSAIRSTRQRRALKIPSFQARTDFYSPEATLPAQLVVIELGFK
eukprot:9499888-Pyramimonas_sp.AAC.2